MRSIWTKLVDRIIRQSATNPYLSEFDYAAGNKYKNSWFLLGGDNLVRNADNVCWSKKRKKAALRRSRLYQWITNLVAIRVHEIVQSDPGTNLHNHPYWTCSVILRWGYVEVTANRGEEKWKERWPGHIVFRSPRDRHRLLTINNKPCWTLFIVGRVPSQGKRSQWERDNATTKDI